MVALHLAGNGISRLILLESKARTLCVIVCVMKEDNHVKGKRSSRASASSRRKKR
jgi:hypothetical protein